MKERADGPAPDLDLNALREILERAPVTRAILFGSYARGTERDSSDVDLAVEFEADLSSRERTRARLQLIERVSTRLGLNDVDVLPLASAPHSLRQEIDEDGVVLIGTDDQKEITERSESKEEPTVEQFDDMLRRLDSVV